jgi:hypothetical protein
MNNENTIERGWLYEQIWMRPATKIAAELGISSSALKKICDAMDVPTPQVGHWQKLEHGKKVRTPELPPESDDTKTSWTIDHTNSKSQKVRKQKLDEVRGAVEKAPAVKISTDLEDLHPLVKSTRAQIQEDAKKLSWDKRKNRRRMNAKVSNSALDRTCLILDTIIRACEAAGYELKSELDDNKPKKNTSPYSDREEPSGICWIEADGEQIGFFMREKSKRVYLPEKEQSWYKKYDDIPSGMLECNLGGAYHSGGRTNWKDGKIQKIEELIPMMIAEIPVIANAKKAERERRARQERRWQYERELRDFEYRRGSILNEAFEQLIKDAKGYRSANIARKYFESVKAQLCHSESNEADDNMTSWIKWAEQAISIMDPIQRESPPWEHESFLSLLENQNLDHPSPPNDEL